MSALAQTPQGDLDLSSGNVVVVEDIAQCTAWKLTNLFRFFKGEWFLDQRVGIPYFQYVLVSSPNLPLIGNMFKRVCLDAPGVAAVTSLSLDYQPRTRNLTVNLALQTDEGAVLEGGVGLPFVVTAQAAS